MTNPTQTNPAQGRAAASTAAVFFFDRPALLELGRDRHEDFVSAQPFSHIVIDSLLPDGLLAAVLTEFPAATDPCWRRRTAANERKLGLSDDAAMGPVTRHLLGQLNSATFLDFLSALTGIRGLIVDPHLVGGGLHQIERGGFLQVHTDFNIHRELDLVRRLNVIVYLNEGWRPEFGGQLELYDADGRCVHQVEPVLNRMLVFCTTDAAHGHPRPLTCPPDRTRRSMALYYYTAVRGDERAHTTLWQAGQGAVAVDTRARRLAADLLPPAALRALRRRRQRRDHADASATSADATSVDGGVG